MRPQHRRCLLVDEPNVVHYTWAALYETFCGIDRIRFMIHEFTSNHVTCIACVVIMERFTANTTSDEELAIARRAQLR